MKKTISLLLALALALNLAACVRVKVADSPRIQAEDEPTAAVTEEPTEEPTAEPTAEPTEEPTPEPTEEPTPEPTEAPTPEPTAEPTPEPTKAPVAAAGEKLRAVRSFHMDVDVNMTMGMVFAMGELKQSIPVDVKVALQGDVIQEPALFRADMTATALGTTTHGLIYGAKEGETPVVYLSLDKGATWQKRSGSQGSDLVATPGDAMGQLLSESVDLQPVGTEEVNGRSATVYAGKLDGKRVQEILQGAAALGEQGETPAVDLSPEAMEEVEDMDVQVMIDEESGLPVRYTVNMAGAMKHLLTAALKEGMAGEESAAFEMDVSAAVLTVTLSGFDQVEAFAIPEAALNAPEA